jgi:hypothetical protein
LSIGFQDQPGQHRKVPISKNLSGKKKKKNNWRTSVDAHYWITHFKMANFMLCEFHLNKKKIKSKNKTNKCILPEFL